MKKFLQIIVLLSVVFTVSSCNKDDNTDIEKQENQLVARIDGKDTVLMITQARIECFHGYKTLSIITNPFGKAIEFYLIAPEIIAGEYPIHSAFTSGLPDKFSHGWLRILQPNSTTTLRAFYSETYSPDYKTVITEISGCRVKGSIRFLGTDQGLNTNDRKLIEGTFSTNLLVVN